VAETVRVDLPDFIDVVDAVQQDGRVADSDAAAGDGARHAAATAASSSAPVIRILFIHNGILIEHRRGGR
jgi:hypothetical protein